MDEPRYKMYVRRDVLTDYTSGMIVVYASSFEDAISKAKESIPDYYWGELMKPYEVYDETTCVWVHGGG